LRFGARNILNLSLFYDGLQTAIVMNAIL
jgi:hypothetical protein